jgi:hypothetical protein
MKMSLKFKSIVAMMLFAAFLSFTAILISFSITVTPWMNIIKQML